MLFLHFIQNKKLLLAGSLFTVGTMFSINVVAELTTKSFDIATNEVDNEQAIPEYDVLFAQARDAMLQNDNRKASMLLDRILRLPPNRVSQQAQELAGIVRERLQETDKAKQEYELYLRLYPEGEDADRVRQRLASLINIPRESISRPQTSGGIESSRLNGSIFQYYYRGNSKIEQTPLNFTPSPLDIRTLSMTDQSALVSNIIMNGRYRDGQSEHRLIFRDTLTNDFRPEATTKNKQRLTNAYYDYRHRTTASSLRVGRQPANNTGVYGRFDGINAATDIVDQWRIGAAGGVMNDYLFDVQPSFYGINTEVNLLDRALNSNLYVIDQTIGNLSDRRAIGMELRYFESTRSLFTAVDYDLLFERTNALLSNGMIAISDAMQFNFAAEYRRIPFLQTSNALLAEPNNNLPAMLKRYGMSDLRQRALNVTAHSYDFMSGVSYKFNPSWQLGFEGRFFRVSDIPGIGEIPATPGTGNIYSATAQLIAASVIGLQDSTVISVSRFYSLTYQGWSASLVERFRIFNRWTAESVTRFYQQRTTSGATSERITPSGKLIYRMNDDVELEIEGGIEDSTSNGLLEADKIRRVFGSAGYQWFF